MASKFILGREIWIASCSKQKYNRIKILQATTHRISFKSNFQISFFKNRILLCLFSMHSFLFKYNVLPLKFSAMDHEREWRPRICYQIDQETAPFIPF